MDKNKVLLVEDNPGWTDAISYYLEQEPDFFSLERPKRMRSPFTSYGCLILMSCLGRLLKRKRRAKCRCGA